VATATEVKNLLLRVDAATQLAQRKLNEFANDVEKGGNRTEKALQRIEAGSARAAAATRNMGRQVSDIGVGLATGQNPFMVLAQQAPQVADALADTGGKAAKVAAFFASPWGAALLAAGSAALIFAPKILGIGDSADATAVKIKSLTGEIDAATAAMKKFIREQSQIGGGETALIAGKLQLEATRSQIGALQGRIAESDGTRAGLQRRMQLQQQLNGLLEKEGTLNATVIALENSRRADAAEAAARDKKDGTADARRAEAERKRRERAALRDFSFEAGIDGGRAGAVIEAVQRLSETALTDVYGADLFQKMSEDAERAVSAFTGHTADELRAMTREADRFNSSLADGLADAIAYGDDLGDVLVNSIRRAAAEAISSGLFDLFSGKAGSGGIGGIFTSFFGGAFANGGNPPVGKVALVGERGPELIVPRSPMTVIPNHALGGGGNQFSLTINAPGATAETVALIRREVANIAPTIIAAAQQTTIRTINRPRI
jgi:hypothetical protein